MQKLCRQWAEAQTDHSSGHYQQQLEVNQWYPTKAEYIAQWSKQWTELWVTRLNKLSQRRSMSGSALILHAKEKMQFLHFSVSSASTETLVRKGGIANQHSIAYSLSNISAKNYQNCLMCVEVIVHNITVVFWDSVKCNVVSVYMVNRQTVTRHSGLQAAIVATMWTGLDGLTPFHSVIHDDAPVRTLPCQTALEKSLHRHRRLIYNKLHRLKQSETVGSHTILHYFGVWGYICAL